VLFGNVTRACSWETVAISLGPSVNFTNEVSTVFCPKCGKELPDDAEFCLKCGRSLASAASVPTKPTRRSTAWLAVGALVIVAICGSVAWRLFFYQDTRPPSVIDAMTSGAQQLPANKPTPATASAPVLAPPVLMSAQEIFQMASSGVALIEVFDDEGRKRGQGSGFIVSPDGTTVTNYHVIRGASRATARFGNGVGSDVDGVVAYDAQRDVAVIKLTSVPSKVLQLGDSDSVKVGDSVVAIGSPLGLQNTLSEGIVSGLRNGIIQMSDPISPGSSGGAVLDLHGNVVGISVATVVAGQNLNFAVPINWAKPYLNAGAPRSLADVAAENTVLQDALNGSVTIQAGQVRNWNLVVNPSVMSNAEIHGEVSSSGGMDGKITLAVYYQNQPIYTCRATTCAIHQDVVAAGNYTLMLDNRQSPIFARTVTGQISVKYVK
jgi:S1-C subfamily serine protease